MKPETRSNLWLFVLLVALGVAGRWLGARDSWGLLSPNFTPMAAIGLFAGYFFASRLTAMLVPLTAMTISNLCLESYNSWLLPIAIYASFAAAPVLGRALRTRLTPSRAIAAIVLPAIFFFLTSNLAQWISDGYRLHTMYGRDWQGLLACYAAGVPFFKWMLEGDLFFVAILCVTFAAAQAGNPLGATRLRHFRSERRAAPSA